ncbi:MAG: hypothetical protein ACI81V_000540 [Lentimonas sp.]|jgi:hypothetical protein
MDRVLIYIVGFGLGTLLVSMMLARRGNQQEIAEDPWVAHNAAMVASGAEVLPAGVPASMRSGHILDFGYLPHEVAASEKVWLLNFDESYPYVRVVQDIESGALTYMAADQVSVHLAEGSDVTELKPLLDELGLRLRMFNRKEQLAVVGVLHTGIDAVPATIQALAPSGLLTRSIEPDWIQFKRPERSE